MATSTEFIRWLNGPSGGGSTSRPWKVVGWAEDLRDDEGPLFWEVVTEVWSGFDRIPHEEFDRLFARFASSIPPCDVPETLTVYRGQDSEVEKGLSWTLSRETAQEFARGHRGIMNKYPLVHEMEVNREHVAFVCNDRDEQEIVLKEIPG